jgi:hypothetical protein
MWCHYCHKNNHNTDNCRAIAKFKQQKKACFEVKAGPGKKSLAFIFEETNVLKRQLKPEKTASSKKRKAESIIFFSTEINLTTNSHEYESEQQEWNYSNERQRCMHSIISRGPDWDHAY